MEFDIKNDPEAIEFDEDCEIYICCYCIYDHDCDVYNGGA